MANYDFGFDQSFDIPSLRKKRFDDFGSFQMPDMGNLNSPDQSDPFDTGDQYQNLFKQNYRNPVSAPSVAAPNNGENLMDEYIKMRERFPGEHTATDRFNQLLNQYPEHEKPSLGRTLVASAAGLGGGAKAAYEVLDRPYVRDVAAWKDKAGPEYNAANLERQSNLGELQSMNQMVGADVNNRRYINQQRGVDERNRITENKNIAQAESTRIRAEAYDFKQRHQDWKFDFSGPNIIAVSPDGKQTANLGPTGHMSDADKINLAGSWGVKRAEAAGIAANTVAQTRNAGQEETARIRNEGRTGGVPTRAQQNATFLAVLNQYPEFEEFVTRPATATGDFRFHPPEPSKGFFGLGGGKVDPEKQRKYEEFRSLFGLGKNQGGQSEEEDPNYETVGPNEPPVAKQTKVPEPRARSIYDPTPVGPVQPQEQGIIGVAKQAGRALTAHPPEDVAPNMYGSRPGYVQMRNAETGEVGWIPQSRARAAEESGKYIKVR